MPQLTGSKERSLFAQVVKNYENKQYKKGELETPTLQRFKLMAAKGLKQRTRFCAEFQIMGTPKL